MGLEHGTSQSSRDLGGLTLLQPCSSCSSVHLYLLFSQFFIMLLGHTPAGLRDCSWRGTGNHMGSAMCQPDST